MQLGFQLATYRDPRVWLVPLLTALCEIDRQYRQARPRTPSVYRAGIRYQTEGSSRIAVPCGTPGARRDGEGCALVRPCECWLDTPTMMCAGVADCEDLACDRAAELQLRGVDAHPWPIVPERSYGSTGQRVIHIIVAFDGRILEDPSARLGMHVPAGFPVEGDRLPDWSV